ncbi:MAG: DUF1588 domain-containing protein [Acidobacteria bacterium]|nr:DUF1588 domain-containing protein [Acidobacteriota bacterium]
MPLRWLNLFLALPLSAQYTFDQGQAFLKTYCLACHQPKSPAGGFALQRVSEEASLTSAAGRWTALAARVRNREMPPKGAPMPPLDQAEQFTAWVDASLRQKACADGPVAGPSMGRRLNRDEYSFTVRDLLDLHIDVARLFPVDGAGGEGFDNAAETLFLSPLLSEKYMDVARFVMDAAAKEYKPRERILVARPAKGVTEVQAARTILENFLPRAFRRPVSKTDVEPYVELFQAARKHGQPFEPAVFYTLRAVLASPMFVFLLEPANNTGAPRPLDPYALASRISYFLWGSMPDELLMDVAAAGKLNDPEVLRTLIPRMLRQERSLDFGQRFTGQWLRTRELTGDKAPDAKLFPQFAADEELRGDIRNQPGMFFREVMVQNQSVLSFIDSTHTIATSNMEKHFDLKLPLRRNQSKQPQWVELPANSRRGGLLGMPAVLAVSSYPYRTSPVLRGAWILDSILGTPPAPPPANVPELEEHKEGAPPKSMRERLSRHRADPVCASCHSRIDGLGFALENYDVIGRWRTEESGKPVDTSGELADGTAVQGPDGLRQVLMARKDLFVRNLTNKLLGYALGRGLTLKDSCAVDQIVDKVRQNDYKAHVLLEAIILSAPFQMQAPAPVPTRKEPVKK